jgi:prepilin-type N-terminal cleavage/methylation domain-containing protein
MRCKTCASFKTAFSMLELIFVIVILGIVASIGSSIIVKVYESYIVQRALHEASSKAELAAMQIANRLTYRISSSVIGRKPGGTYLPLDQVPDETYTTLEWIAYDNDSFSAQTTPGWSGYCDLNTTTRTNINTPGSDLDGITSTVIGNLGGSAATDLALVFDGHEYNNTTNYDARCMGFTDSNCIFRPTISDATNLATNLTVGGPTVLMRDQYKLVWTAYALVPSGNTLTLHYNYQPWNGIQRNAGSSTVLVDNFVSFRFKGNGDTVRFKLCIQESIGDQNVTICKEKAVIR